MCDSGGFSTEIENEQVIALCAGLCATSVSRGIDSVWTWALSDSVAHARNLEMEPTRDRAKTTKHSLQTDQKSLLSNSFCLFLVDAERDETRRWGFQLLLRHCDSKTNRAATKFPLRKTTSRCRRVAHCCLNWLPRLIRLHPGNGRKSLATKARKVNRVSWVTKTVAAESV